MQNPGFEGISRPGGYTHNTLTGEVHGNFVSPDEWTGWWDETGPRRRPETAMIFREAPYIGPPARISVRGDWAVKMQLPFHPWTGGYVQVVDVEPGETYRTGYMAHAWANHDGFPNNDDPGCSACGCGPIWVLEESLNPLNGDPANDAWWAARFQVGIQHLAPGDVPDPTYNVQWQSAAAIYNVYQPVPTIEFEAAESRVAVFIRCEFLWGFRNNDAYIDGAFFYKLTDEPDPPDPPDDACDGRAREEYERVYVLLPPDATGTEMRYLIDKYWDNRFTFGFSADDAGIGCGLKSRRVIAVRPDAWPEDLELFFAVHYPGVIYEVEPPQVLLGQRDPTWANEGFGEK